MFLSYFRDLWDSGGAADAPSESRLPRGLERVHSCREGACCSTTCSLVTRGFTVAVQQAKETTELVKDPGAAFEELVEDFAEALDAWSQKVKGALNGRPQKVLVNGLHNVNQSKVSRWLSGREQIWKGQAALPGVGLTQGIVQVLELQGSEAALLMQLADRVDQLQKQLMERKGWRKQAGDYLQRRSGGETSSDSALASVPRAGRRKWQRQPWRGQPIWVKASLGMAVIAAVVIVTAAVVPDGDEGVGGSADGAAPKPSPSASMSSTTQGGSGTVPSESPGLEKGTLGEDSRCSAPFAGPGPVAWRVCARVEAEQVSFALKIANHGSKAATVKIRLEYVQATESHLCPKESGTHLLDVPAGETVITEPGQCSAPREETPFAYQGKGWVLPEDANAGSYKLSPAAHVYPDRVIWQPDLV
ncbi:hypothetical protein [Streptomyces pseudogriseolus]|uniref:hypothetical protein n=1 Tax=Streptomyces pseudogriseolus TaxID=36817 RepID=UPI003FA23BDA